MVWLVLVIFGLCAGSFVNAFVWRFRKRKNWLSERSECVHCHHILSAIDLVPIISWVCLRGKCRYCHKPISVQYPIVEALVTLLFILSYVFWPQPIIGAQIAIFVLWLVVLTGLVALMVYDLKWMLLPSRIVYFLLVIAGVIALISIFSASDQLTTALGFFFGSILGGGLFYLIYLISKGKWIGGGDVRLGFLLGLLAATPLRSFLLIFIASIIGTLVAIFLIGFRHMKRTSVIPFGPFLITAMFIIQFGGQDIINWYTKILLGQ